jgi:hypothetical protein
VSVRDPNAVCFCAYGAIIKAMGQQTTGYTEVEDALDEASRKLFGENDYVKVNDISGFDAIHKVFDEAISVSS